MENILNYNIQDLEEYMTSIGEKKFRASQVFKWISNGIDSWDKMTNISKELSKKLESDFYIGLPAPILVQKSAIDGTIKVLFQLVNNENRLNKENIESVFMKYSYGNTICISSELGCKMGCKFCASTKNGLIRGLSSGEMYGQVLSINNLTGEKINHIVVMGIGEPFDNYEELSKFIRLINNPKGYNLGMRNITISSCGIIPYIDRFAHDFPQANLAISLHAPNDEIRKTIMPIANKYKITDLIDECKKYTLKTHRRVTFEYALIRGINDSIEDARELSKLLSGILCHVNLIPLNDVDNTNLNASKEVSIYNFKKVLDNNSIPVTIRRKLGSDIDAACGQLRARKGV